MYRRSSLAQDIPMQQDVASANLSGVTDYSVPFGVGEDDVQMEATNLPRRRFSIHDLGHNQHQPHHQQQQHQKFPTDNPATYDLPRGSFDRPCADSYGAASSPYASRQETGSSSGPISNAGSPYTSSGAVPSSLSTPTFGHHPSPPTFGHQQVHASPVSYGPSSLANPTSHNFYVANGFEAQYNNGLPLVGLGMEDNGNNGGDMVSTVVDTPVYEKPHQIMYDVKPPNTHHLGNETLQQPFQVDVDQGHAPAQNHGMSAMVPSQTWSQENEPGHQGNSEYWGGEDYKFYH